ncbi:hypothetical protein RRG08_062789 [Elysia crispata]|uniref:Uncharacterized protein n=1 Tax=Elysia crispata TaxID=231223 RepID=A0AAE1E3T6_9GAST|nr:hypothetical protein RRG08_062789 [Elysia crispata]
MAPENRAPARNCESSWRQSTGLLLETGACFKLRVPMAPENRAPARNCESSWRQSTGLLLETASPHGPRE